MPTAVLLLLSALTLPGTPHPFSAKAIYINDPMLSADISPQDVLGNPDGDDQEFSVAYNALTSRLPLFVAAFSSIPAPAPNFAHTVSQARAPPLS